MASHKAEVEQAVSPVLSGVMAAGEQVVSGVQAVTGPAPWLLAVLGLPLAAALTALGVAELSGATPPHRAAGLLPLLLALVCLLAPAAQLLNKRVFLAVTDRQLICCRMSRPGRPGQLVSAAPVAAGHISSYRPGRWWSSFRCTLPEAGGRPGRARRVNVARPWHPELTAMLTVLGQAGAHGDQGMA